MARTKGSKSGIHAKKTGPKPKAQKLAQKKEAEGEANRSRVIFSSFLKPASDLDPHNGNADKTDLSLKKDLLENPAIPTTLEIGLSSISSSGWFTNPKEFDCNLNGQITIILLTYLNY